ncbi:hypothetical protein [Aeromonas sp. D3]|uniref:hypothetical protein n=1 Tax=Aeromonas sp. D3 TaxID=2990474 RepID=UPI0022E639E8|nr:hypothetical protein [Aeromonas sp. D3]
MAMHHVTETSYHALQSLGDTACALAELADVIPSEDRYSALLRILSDRLDSDMQAMQREVHALWTFVPEVPDTEE